MSESAYEFENSTGYPDAVAREIVDGLRDAEAGRGDYLQGQTDGILVTLRLLGHEVVRDGDGLAVGLA